MYATIKRRFVDLMFNRMNHVVYVGFTENEPKRLSTHGPYYPGGMLQLLEDFKVICYVRDPLLGLIIEKALQLDVFVDMSKNYVIRKEKIKLEADLFVHCMRSPPQHYAIYALPLPLNTVVHLEATKQLHWLTKNTFSCCNIEIAENFKPLSVRATDIDIEDDDNDEEIEELERSQHMG